MDLSIKITGPAGTGINSTSDIIINIFGKFGYNVISDVEYESRIKGGVNFFQIFVSDKLPFLSKYCDVLLGFNLESLKKNINSLKKDGVVFVSKKIQDSFDEDIKEIIIKNNIEVVSTQIDSKYDNIYLLGLFSNYFSLKSQVIKDCIKEMFEKKGSETVNSNIEIYKNILASNSKKGNLEITKFGKEKQIIYGNKAIAYGAIDNGLEYYGAYPMTPASTILTEIIASKKVIYLQAEDEIAVMNSALGASFTGARSMVGTSGGGFALMSEALSFGVQAEIGVVAVLSQRAGPSTGTPTYHETGDLNFALNPTFGDFNHIVLSPSSLEEAYFYAGFSLNLADKYQNFVILLIDKQLSELIGTVGKLKTAGIDRGKILKTPKENYKRYELTKSGISPRVEVGTKNGDFIATSYEHDEYGATTEDPETKKLMTEKRWRKLENFFQKEDISGFEIINKEAKKMIVTFSATAYTARKFIEENNDFGLIVIKFLKPLDEKLLEYLRDKEEIIFIENNYSGQLEKYICDEFGLKFIKGLKISNLRKYDLFPFYMEDFEELIK